MSKFDKEATEYDEVKQETPLAWLLTIDDRNIWLPKSQCEIDPDNNKDPLGKGLVMIPNWLADQKGI